MINSVKTLFFHIMIYCSRILLGLLFVIIVRLTVIYLTCNVLLAQKNSIPIPFITFSKIQFSKCVFCFQVFADFWIPFSRLYFSILFVQGMLLLYVYSVSKYVKITKITNHLRGFYLLPIALPKK